MLTGATWRALIVLNAITSDFKKLRWRFWQVYIWNLFSLNHFLFKGCTLSNSDVHFFDMLCNFAKKVFWCLSAHQMTYFSISKTVSDSRFRFCGDSFWFSGGLINLLKTCQDLTVTFKHNWYHFLNCRVFQIEKNYSELFMDSLEFLSGFLFLISFSAQVAHHFHFQQAGFNIIIIRQLMY